MSFLKASPEEIKVQQYFERVSRSGLWQQRFVLTLPDGKKIGFRSDIYFHEEPYGDRPVQAQRRA